MKCDCGEILKNYLWDGDCEYNEKGEMISYNEEMKCEKCNKWFIIKKIIINKKNEYKKTRRKLSGTSVVS